MRNYNNPGRHHIVQVHIADIHFGSVDPLKEYQILQEQFLDVISRFPFHILAIDGDLFHKKYLANSQPIYYASLFVDQCVNICRDKNATLLILSGTESHDAGQLRLFEHYTLDNRVDVRIINKIGFEMVYGLKILCIPEEYGKKEDYYFEYLSQNYDCCFMHGTVVGSVYGAHAPDLNSPKYPIFDINAFSSCRGPIICGHVHKAMCLQGYIYYVSNPVRFAHNEEEEKGFGIVVIDPVSMAHSYKFIPIHSFIYRTISMRQITTNDPYAIIDYLDKLKRKEGIDYIRLDCSEMNRDFLQTQRIIEQYFASDGSFSIKSVDVSPPDRVQSKAVEEIEDEKNRKLSEFILNPAIDDYSKMVYFINENEGSEFITIDRLKEILEGGI